MTVEQAAGTAGKLIAEEFLRWFESATVALPPDVLQTDFDIRVFESDVMAAFNGEAPVGSLPIFAMPGLEGLVSTDTASFTTKSCVD